MDLLTSFQGRPPAEQLLLGGAFLSIALLLYLLVSYRDGRAIGTSPRPDLYAPPGSTYLLGNAITMLQQGGRQLEYFSKIRAEQKDKSKAITLTAPGIRMIDITHPDYIRHFQSTVFGNYEKGYLFHEIMHEVLGGGIFVVDGEKWNVQRKATSKIFTANNFRNCISSSIEQDIKKLRTIIGRYADSGKEFDLSALFFRFTLSSFCQMAFGQDIGALSLDSDAPVPFAVAFDYAQAQMSARTRNPKLWSYFERFDGSKKKMRDAVKVIDDFAYDLIQQREKEGLSNMTAADKKDRAANDLLSLYLAIRDENGQPMSKTALRDAVLNLIIAGRDTTAQALSWTWFHLMANPEMITPLRAEVDEKGEVDYDNYKSMTRTLAVLNEGLRLHPSVPKNFAMSKFDDQLPDGGPMVKAGDLLRWSDWELGRSQELWGPDASTFKPSRWIDADGNLKKESQWKHHAFNGGPRVCLGQNLATYESTVAISAIIKDFDLSFAPGYLESTEMIEGERTPRYLDSLTLPMKDPLRVTAAWRKHD